MNNPKDYHFTFTQGSELRNHYVIIHDTYDRARERMMAIFSDKWAFQYANADKADVAKYNLTCLINLH